MLKPLDGLQNKSMDDENELEACFFIKETRSHKKYMVQRFKHLDKSPQTKMQQTKIAVTKV